MNRRIIILDEDDEEDHPVLNIVRMREITGNDTFFARRLHERDQNIPLLPIWDNPHLQRPAQPYFNEKDLISGG
jgi:hypothetical protein